MAESFVEPKGFEKYYVGAKPEAEVKAAPTTPADTTAKPWYSGLFVQPDASLPDVTPPVSDYNKAAVAAGKGALGSVAEGVGGLTEIVAPKTGGEIANYGKRQIDEANKISRPGSILGQVGSFAVPIAGEEMLAAKIGRPAAGAVTGGVAGLATPYGPYHSFAMDKALPGALGAGAGGILGSIPDLLNAAKGFSPMKQLAKIAPDFGENAIGKAIRDRLEDTLKGDLRVREAQSVKDYALYFAQGKPLEPVIKQDFGRFLANYATNNQGKLLPDEMKLVQKTYQETQNLGIEGLDKYRTYLADIAKRAPNEGTGANLGRVANELRDALGSSIQTNVSSASTAWTNYKFASEPVNWFNSVVGKGATERGNGYLPTLYTKVEDPAKLLPKIFDSAHSVEMFTRLTGDPKFVKDQARAYVVNQLSTGIQNSPSNAAKIVDKFLVDNRDWIARLPGLDKELKQYAEVVGAAKRLKETGKTALKIGAGAAGLYEAHRIGKDFGLVP